MQTWNLEIIMKIVGTVYDPENQAGMKLKYGENLIIFLWSAHMPKIIFYWN